MRALPFGFLGPRGPSAQWEEGWGPPLRSSHDAGAPPCTPAYYFTMRGATPLCTPRGEGAPPLRPRVTFPSRGKSPKARQGLCPLESPEGDRLKSVSLFSPAPPAAVPQPPRWGLYYKTRPICHFGFVGKSVFFSPRVLRGNIFCFQSVARGCRFASPAFHVDCSIKPIIPFNKTYK